MKKIKFGVLGRSNHFQSRVLNPVSKLENAEIYAIASRDETRAKDFAAGHGIPRFYGSYEKMLEDNDIDAVYIPLPNSMHLEWIKKCADAGKHIICEKPLCLNTKETEKALAHAHKKGVSIMEAFMYKFHPQWIRAASLVKSKEIGEIRTIHVFFGYDNRDSANIRNMKELGGGAILDIGCYAVSTARFLFDAEPARVMGIIDYDREFKTDILASGTLDFANGSRSLFTVGTQIVPFQKVEVFGTGGYFAIEIPFNMPPEKPAKIYLKNQSGERIIEEGPADQYGLEFSGFAQSILDNADVPIPPRDAVNNMKVLDALFESGKTGRWINI